MSQEGEGVNFRTLKQLLIFFIGVSLTLRSKCTLVRNFTGLFFLQDSPESSQFMKTLISSDELLESYAATSRERIISIVHSYGSERFKLL